MNGKKKEKKQEFDLKLLKHWKRCSTKSKLQWLEGAMRFAKLKKF